MSILQKGIDRATAALAAVYPPTLALLVDQHVIGVSTAVDVAAIVSAFLVGLHVPAPSYVPFARAAAHPPAQDTTAPAAVDLYGPGSGAGA